MVNRLKFIYAKEVIMSVGMNILL